MTRLLNHQDQCSALAERVGHAGLDCIVMAFLSGRKVQSKHRGRRTTMHCETLEHPKDGSPMVLIPAGAFRMGLPENDFLAEEHEKPQRLVFLAAFWMDIYPVTNARFGQFIEAGGYEQPAWWTAEGWEWRCG